MPAIPNLAPVDICNFALGDIGQSPIVSMADTDPKSVLCNNAYTFLLNGMLRDHKWNFATKRQSLAEIPTPPVSGWQHAFQLPTDCCRIWKLNDSDRVDYKVEGRTIVTNDTEVIIEYVAYIDEPNQWDGMFAVAFQTLLSSKLCGPLTGNLKRMQELYNLALAQMFEAKGVDGQEQSQECVTSPEIIAIRDWGGDWGPWGPWWNTP